MRLVRLQTRMELLQILRNYEQLLLVMVIPLFVLVFFGNVDVLPGSSGIASLTASVLTLAVVSSAMVSLGISTGFDRSYHVLKRLGATPLGRQRLVAAKILAVIIVQSVQCTVLLAVASALGWRTTASVASLVGLIPAIALGSLACGGLGLILAGRLRAEVNLAAQNGLYLVLIVAGGVIIAPDDLPGPLATFANIAPTGALSSAITGSLAGDGTVQPWLVLAAWAIVLPTVAARIFRFEATA
jgi:ABC-2 type transport system permease protein